MDTNIASTDDEGALRDKYGSDHLDRAPADTRNGFLREVRRRDRLDQHFTKIWLAYVVDMHRRPQLDERTRYLTLIGQFTVTRSDEHLANTLRSALDARVAPREALEVMLQSVIYTGDTTLRPALATFERVCEELDLMDAVGQGQLPLDGRDDQRDLEAERAAWHPDDRDDARLDGLLERHGWLGISTGLLQRPGHHLDLLSNFESIDEGFADLWVRFTYQGMYSRSLLDDRTRLLCVVADFVALKESRNLRDHMKGALRAGAAPGEIAEIIFLSSVYFGMPVMGQALRTFIEVMTELGRLDEVRRP